MVIQPKNFLKILNLIKLCDDVMQVKLSNSKLLVCLAMAGQQFKILAVSVLTDAPVPRTALSYHLTD